MEQHDITMNDNGRHDSKHANHLANQPIELLDSVNLIGMHTPEIS